MWLFIRLFANLRWSYSMEHHQNQLILVTLSGYFCLELSCARISARRAGEPALLLPWNRVSDLGCPPAAVWATGVADTKRLDDRNSQNLRYSRLISRPIGCHKKQQRKRQQFYFMTTFCHFLSILVIKSSRKLVLNYNAIGRLWRLGWSLCSILAKDSRKII